jgi:hypothetical protein
MTRSPEKGENEITEAAKREAMRTGVPIREILERMLEEARKAKDVERQRKIVTAQKYLCERNLRKRRGRK